MYPTCNFTYARCLTSIGAVHYPVHRCCIAWMALTCKQGRIGLGLVAVLYALSCKYSGCKAVGECKQTLAAANQPTRYRCPAYVNLICVLGRHCPSGSARSIHVATNPLLQGGAFS